MNKTKIQRAALYSRVSTINQVEHGNSIDFQADQLKNYAKFHKFKIVDEYIDAGYSGYNTNRPNLQRMINDIKANKIDTVIVYKLDRLSRNTKQTLIIIEDIFNTHNINFISLHEQFDTSTPIGRATLNMLSTLSQLERDNTALRMKDGKRQAVKKGKYINHAPLGYIKKNGKLVKDPKSEHTINYIIKLLLDKHSLNNIVRELNTNLDYGLGRFWHINEIRRVKENPAYCGHTFLMNILVKNTHEAYMSEEQQKIIKELSTSRMSNPSTTIKRNVFKSLFRGRVKCPHCHRRLSVSRHPFKSGEKHIYKCIYCIRDKKISQNIREEIIEEAFINKINSIVSDFETNFNTEEQQDNIEIIDFTKDYSLLENKRLKIQHMYINSIINEDEMNTHLSNLDKELNKIKEKEREQEQILKFQRNKSSFIDFAIEIRNMWYILDYDAKVTMLENLVEYIEIEQINKPFKRFKTSINVLDIKFRVH